jgi:hypothetical protein
MYFTHPSQALNRACACTAVPGAVPEDALYVFVGLDANYGQTIEQQAVFPDLLEYLEDGVSSSRSRIR